MKHSPKFTSLGEANHIEPTLEIGVESEVLADHVNLFIGILEEAIENVLLDGATDLNGAEVDAWHIFAHHLHQFAQAEWKAATVT